MSEQLVSLIAVQAGVTNEQAEKAVEIIAAYVKEQYPLLHGSVDSILGTKTSPVIQPS